MDLLHDSNHICKSFTALREASLPTNDLVLLLVAEVSDTDKVILDLRHTLIVALLNMRMNRTQEARLTALISVFCSRAISYSLLTLLNCRLAILTLAPEMKKTFPSSRTG